MIFLIFWESSYTDLERRLGCCAPAGEAERERDLLLLLECFCSPPLSTKQGNRNLSHSKVSGQNLNTKTIYKDIKRFWIKILEITLSKFLIFGNARISQNDYTGELGYDGPLYDGFLPYDGQYAWSQSDTYQVFLICIWRILHMTDQFFWSHWVRHIQVHLYLVGLGLTSNFFLFDSLTYFFRFRLFRFDSRFLYCRLHFPLIIRVVSSLFEWRLEGRRLEKNVWHSSLESVVRDKYFACFVLSVCICPSPHPPKGKAHAEAPLSAAFRALPSGKTNTNYNNMWVLFACLFVFLCFAAISLVLA